MSLPALIVYVSSLFIVAIKKQYIVCRPPSNLQNESGPDQEEGGKNLLQVIEVASVLTFGKDDRHITINMSRKSLQGCVFEMRAGEGPCGCVFVGMVS